MNINKEGYRRNLERKGYSKRPKHAKEFKYYVCGCGAFGCTHQKGEIKLKCKECHGDCFILFNAPKISNTFKCEDCDFEWMSNAIYKNWSCCRKCQKTVWPTKFYFGELYSKIDKINQLIRRKFVEYGDYGESFNLFCDELHEAIIKIAKDIYF